MYMNLIIILFALVCCLLAFLIGGLYIRGKRFSNSITKILFLLLMFLSIMSLAIGVILTIFEK